MSAESTIEYLEGDGNYTTIHYANGTKGLSSIVLCKLTKRFGLLRIHKNYAINTSYTKRLGDLYVYLKSRKLPVSRRRHTSVAKVLSTEGKPVKSRKKKVKTKWPTSWPVVKKLTMKKGDIVIADKEYGGGYEVEIVSVGRLFATVRLPDSENPTQEWDIMTNRLWIPAPKKEEKNGKSTDSM